MILSLIKKTNIDPSAASTITALTIFTILAGYSYYQLWMLIFEGAKQSYKSEFRKALQKIDNKFSDKNLSGNELYAIWENVLYARGDKAKEIFNKDKGLWRFYHQSKSFVVGYAGGFLISFLLIWLLFNLGFSAWWLYIIPSLQLLLLFLANKKAQQTFNLLEIFESSLVDTWASDFSEAVETVVNSREPTSKPKSKRK